MRNAMLDLETLGTRPGCVILSIGAVKFDGENLGDEFYKVIKIDSCKEVGLTTDNDTLAWWAKRSPEARAVFADPNSLALKETLHLFSRFMDGTNFIWGNGSDFDQPVLDAAYYAAEIRLPWKYWNSRCYRTMKSLLPSIKIERTGTYHNALEDAKSQAAHLIEICKILGVRL